MQITLTTSGGTQDLTGTVTVTVTPNLPGVTSVRFYVDDVLIGTVTASPFTYDWDTTPAAGGSHQLKARAFYSKYQVREQKLNVSVSEEQNVFPSPPLPSPPSDPIQDAPVLMEMEEE